MQKIYKYKIEVIDEQDIQIPNGAEILSVTEQYGDIVLYANVDSEADLIPYHISIRGTGHNAVGLKHKFLGTVKLVDGALMFHVFGE